MKVTEIKQKKKIQNKKIRVAAYARTSSDKDVALNSLSAQVSHYNELISKHLDWEFAGIFIDEGVSGAKEKRPEFERLLKTCREGKVDMVVTKSITRFARNTLVLLREVQNLKQLGVDVFFELENIHTMSITGEVMLTAFASFAEDQAKRISDYTKWNVSKKFKQGIPTYFRLYGYKMKDSELIIIPEEAKIVKKIFQDYLSGKGRPRIAKELNELNIKTIRGSKWNASTILDILRNDKYTGNLLLQKVYRPSFRSNNKKLNNNVLPRYFVKDNHEAIISEKTFNATQMLLDYNQKNPNYHKKKMSPFSRLLTCANCGKHYSRKSSRGSHIWRCQTYHDFGKNACSNKQIKEDMLVRITKETLGMDSLENIAVRDYIKEIICHESRILEYLLQDGTHIYKAWSPESRSKSWTNEMREQARETAYARYSRTV